MHVHGFRYYDPEIGRYLTRDPAGYADGLNVYLYVHNNPINFIDPLGLGPWADMVGQWIDKGESFLQNHAQNDAQRALIALWGAEARVASTLLTGGELVGEQIGEYASALVDDPAGALVSEKTPILGPTGKHLGEASNNAIQNPSVDTICDLGAAFCESGLTVLGGVETARGLKGNAKTASGRTPEGSQPPVSRTPEGTVVTPEGGAPPGTKIDGLVFRSGGHTPDTFTPRPGLDLEGLSTFDTLEAAVKPGGKAQIIDMAKVEQPLVGVPDAPPPGHVSIRSGAAITETVLQETADWAATRGTGVVHPLTDTLMRARVGEARRPK